MSSGRKTNKCYIVLVYACMNNVSDSYANGVQSVEIVQYQHLKRKPECVSLSQCTLHLNVHITDSFNELITNNILAITISLLSYLNIKKI